MHNDTQYKLNLVKEEIVNWGTEASYNHEAEIAGNCDMTIEEYRGYRNFIVPKLRTYCMEATEELEITIMQTKLGV